MNNTIYIIIILVALAIIPLGYWIYRTGKVQVIQIDAAWKKHVERLQKQGIDTSYIKRTPEWEKSQQNDAKVYMAIGLIISTFVPALIIGMVVLAILF